MENLFIGRSSRAFAKYSTSIAFLRPLIAGHGSVPNERDALRWLLHCAVLPVIFLLAPAPCYVLNTIQFHSPFKTGYDFWTPFLKEHHLLFSLRYMPRNAGELWRQLLLQPHTYDAVQHLRHGIFLCSGLRPSKLRRSCLYAVLNWFHCCAFLAGLSSFVAQFVFPLW